MLIADVGMPGSYKTTWLTAMTYDAYLNGRDVMANYTLNFPHERGCGRILPIDLTQIATEESIIEELFLALDEIHVWFDAKRHSSDNNIQGSHILLQARKRGCDVAGTSQSFRYVEGRFRDNCNLLLLHKRPDPNVEMGYVFAYDKTARRINGRLKSWEPDFAFDPRPIYPLFDTNQRMMRPQAPPPPPPKPRKVDMPPPPIGSPL